MHKTPLTLSLGFFAALVLGLSLPSLVAAQSSAGLSVAPAIIEDRLEPGQTYDFTMTVTNLAQKESVITASARDIEGINAGGQPKFAPEQEKTPYELSSWVTFREKEFTLGPGDAHTLAFSITVPEDASPGSHFGGVFFVVDADRAEAEGAASVIGYQVGTILNMRLSGEVQEDAAIRSFTSDKFIYDAPDVNFTLRLENLGNVLVRPHGFVEITNMRGVKVDTIEVNKAGAGVFPASEREFEAKWQTDTFALGRYQASASVVYGEDGRKTITSTLSFWVLPMKLIGGILGGFVVLILALYFGMRMMIRRKVRQMAELTGARLPQGSIRTSRGGALPSRFTFVAVALLIFSMVFLGFLFVLFA